MNSKNDLRARYVYAVTRHLPQKIRTDVEKELDSLISDMLDERCGENESTEKDIKIVLLELGTPGELAAKYSGDEQKVLLSGIYYIYYKKMLKLVLPIVAAAVALGMFISILADPPEVSVFYIIPLLFGKVIGGAIAGVWQAFAIITVIFVILERTKADLNTSDFSTLPEVPKQVERIKPYEPIFGIFFSIVAALVFLGFPQIIGWHSTDGIWTPVFDAAVLRSLWLPIILWTVFGIIIESVKLIEGQNTKRLAITTVVGNLLIIFCVAVVFLNNNIINQDLMPLIESTFGDNGENFIPKLISSAHLIFFGIVSIALIIETLTVIVKACKYSKSQ